MIRTIAAVCTVLWVAAAASSGTIQQPRALRLDERASPLPRLATSFDCTKARKSVERMICGDRNLATEDGSMGQSFLRLKRNLTATELNALVRSQRAWIERRDSCAHRQCVERAL